MKLAIVRQRYNPFGGAERFVERALQALVTQGTEVTLLTRSWKNESRPGFNQIICNPPPTGLLAGRTGRDQAFSNCVQAKIAEGNFDLIQSHERIPGCDIFRAGDGVHAAWLARRTQTMSPLRRFTQDISRYHRYILATEKAMLTHQGLKAVICNSQMVAEEIRQYYGVESSKLHVIYNGIDMAHFHPDLANKYRETTRENLGVSENAPLLLYVGSGYERKGVPQLLQALSTMHRKDAHLVIAGSDRRIEATKTLANKYGLAARTHFLGPVLDLRPLYGAADGFVLPSIYDPCPNAALEAMASGLPMVTSQGCGAKEWVEDDKNGWVVDITTSSALPVALDKLCAAKGSPTIRSNARMAVAHLDLKNMADQLIHLYETLHQQSTA